ncbi:MAG: hypothetical protein U0Z26_19160 [Anaerolineales bacterium]
MAGRYILSTRSDPVLEFKAYPTLSAIPEPVELIVVVTPSQLFQPLSKKPLTLA